MTLAALLALGSSVAWGVSDFLGGRRSAALSTLTVLLVSQVASLLLLAVGVVVLGPALPPAGSVGVTVLAGLGEVVGIGDVVVVEVVHLHAGLGPVTVNGSSSGLGWR